MNVPDVAIRRPVVDFNVLDPVHICHWLCERTNKNKDFVSAGRYASLRSSVLCHLPRIYGHTYTSEFLRLSNMDCIVFKIIYKGWQVYFKK